jgi:hypothetical protein
MIALKAIMLSAGRCLTLTKIIRPVLARRVYSWQKAGIARRLENGARRSSGRGRAMLVYAITKRNSK